MVYLIGQLAAWLLLAAAFAALAGWSFAAHLAGSVDAKARRDRANLVRDLTALIGETTHALDAPELQRERDGVHRMAEVREGRIVELEHALETARSNTAEAHARTAELERALATMTAAHAEPRAIAVDLAPASDPEHDPALQTWRVRYLEQRVRYLESAAPAASAPAEPAPEPAFNLWRARVAEARAAHAENEIRELLTTPAPEDTVQEQASPFAANADVDVLLRWRMLYLERRVAHLQARAPAPASEMRANVPIEAEAASSPDPDRWMWRARYLEARARHLEHRLSTAIETSAAAVEPLAAPAASIEDAPAAPAPLRRGVKPPILQAPRHGAPDDFTLIDGVGLLQQTTLYALGVFHYDQIAAWTDDHVGWIDHYLRLRGRIDDEEWRQQAGALAREGPAARRVLAEADA